LKVYFIQLQKIENEFMNVRDFKNKIYNELASIARALANPHRLEIIAYCRGPLCAMADDAIKLLNEHGYRATRLEAGYPEWQSKGFPVIN
jgi:rhodanese-related sulfurtransferase